MNNESLVELEKKSQQLIKDNATEIYNCAMFFCRSKQNAEDLAHEVCVNILTTDPSKLTSIGNVQAYLRRCVKNAAVSSGRIARSRSNRAEVATPEGENDSFFGVDDRMENIAANMDVYVAIRELGAEDQMLIYLKYYLDFNIKKAVREATGLTGSKAFKRHQSVLDQLRELLMKETD